MTDHKSLGTSHQPDHMPSLLIQAQTLLTPLYQESGRAYHGLGHIQALLKHLGLQRKLANDVRGIKLAIWFHDAVYDTTRHDNEEQSAQLAERYLPEWGCPADLVASVARKVRATQRHEWLDGDTDTALFLDLDLSVLAARFEVYDRYAEQIAQEYAWVPAALYLQGRAQVLAGFLQRDHIYFTPSLRLLWESAARANLQREMSQITSSNGQECNPIYQLLRKG